MKKKATPKSSQSRTKNANSVAAQHLRIEEALRANPAGLTTIELVEQYDILRPGSRINEMRWWLGMNIQSVRVSDTTAKGHSHRVVRYVLQPGKWKPSGPAGGNGV
ncbi:hypothetical protein I6N98_15900 [Spongiibacter nanhainus]|uniref:Winged helix-turn-helix domain-containing protein n=1 Tax=Spongiibacter nanhainus TaxID=2794344 RepID=A0A7T4R000_9GAMM|nr:hypothetical protein I6N98_15900 [Spongiibacter nanhainus]